ncbi:NAD(P)/FAD-dependent oxidoreductase [Cohnella suwonensis]|uniref:NAD(P)/FAD-dependent oxidoreductase n=1 Tax=Cohnella suwonensis TaxID=696072 RepID=A0ABW0LXX5_9BACL
MNNEYDVIVVGARVAGSSLAYHLSRAGFSVLLLDRGTFPSDVLSTHNLFGNSLGMLRDMGVLGKLFETPTPTYRRLRIQFGSAVIDGTIPETEGETECFCIRRTYLDGILFEHAKAQPGVTAIEGFRVTGLLRDGDRVYGVVGKRKEDSDGDPVSYTAKLVAGADGRLSAVRKLAGSPCLMKVATDFASYVGYVSGFVQEGDIHAEMYRQEDKYAIAFPTSDGLYAFGVMFPLDSAEWTDAFKLDPDAGMRAIIEEGFGGTTLPERLREATFVGPVRGLRGYDNDWHQGMGKGWALVGDALTFKDPTVGTGMHDALYGARTLSSLLAGTPRERWTDEWENLADKYQKAMESKLMSHFMLGCQLTANVPIPPEQEAVYRLIGADEEATRVFLGFYNYKSSLGDIEREIGRLAGMIPQS